MAGAGWRDFVAGEVLTAANVQDYLQDQSVMVFGGTAARGSAIASPSEGMTTYLTDSNTIETYSGSGWERQTGGLIPISPTSVTIATGSATVNALGLVTFTGASSISLDGVFNNALYNNYKILLIATNTANSDLNFNFRIGGSNLSDSTYTTVWIRTTAAAVSTGAVAGATSAQLVMSTGNTVFYSDLSLYNMNATTSKMFAAHSRTGAFYQQPASGEYNGASKPDGIKLTPSTGTFTGTIQVFGYND